MKLCLKSSLGVKKPEEIQMDNSFKGRAVLPGEVQGEALVTQLGFNTYASFYNNLRERSTSAICADSGNLELYGKDLTGKIICLPKTTGSTSAGTVWQRIARFGVAPKAMLFSQSIDSLAAGGLVVADIWAGERVCTVDSLGDDFLQFVQEGDWVKVAEDGQVIVEKD
jgi:predicted aconitase with swiveling domain